MKNDYSGYSLKVDAITTSMANGLAAYIAKVLPANFPGLVLSFDGANHLRVAGPSGAVQDDIIEALGNAVEAFGLARLEEKAALAEAAADRLDNAGTEEVA